MGFLDNLRNISTNASPSEWLDLNSLDLLDNIEQNSSQKPIILFKHSTTCGISASALSKITQQWTSKSPSTEFYLLDLLSYREISNQIAKQFDVVHQSPQILVIKNGKCIFNASHHAIDLEKVRPLLGDNL